jgi:hypothetical protein
MDNDNPGRPRRFGAVVGRVVEPRIETIGISLVVKAFKATLASGDI